MKVSIKIVTFFLLFYLAFLPACQVSPEPTQTPTLTPGITESASETPTEAPSAMPLAEIPPELAGKWVGKIVIQGTELEIIVNFSISSQDLSAQMDIPVQNFFAYDLANVSYSDGRVHFEGLAKANRMFVCDGQLSAGRIEGDFAQSGMTGSFYLTPWVEEEAVSYRVEEVIVQNQTITLGCTLTLPEGDGPFPAVVLVTGSGQQGRDEQIGSFKVFGVLADYLTNQGIVVLRCDDRGFNGSSGNFDQSTQSGRSQRRHRRDQISRISSGS